MAENDKPKFDLPWATLLPLIAVFAGIVAQYKPLVSSRPAVPAEKAVEIVTEQDVDARLWQDPIAVAEKQKALLDADINTGHAPADVVNSHDITALANLLQERAKEKHVLLLAVMLDAGPYSEQGESRLRARQAVLEGLSESGFVPMDGEHIGFVTAKWPPPLHWPPLLPPPGSTAMIDRALLLPWEECDTSNPTRILHSGAEQVFVLWLPAVSFNPDPLRRFAAVIDQLAGDIRDKIDVKLIGPANSAGLQNMIREACEEPG